MKSKGHILMILSVIAVIMAALDLIFKIDILNLAGTQWVLIGIILAVWGNHAESCGACAGKSGQQ
jgi:hypothetical protein